MAAIIFQPGDRRVECQVGESIYEVAWREGRPLSSACGAKASCGLCRVKILAGGEHLSSVGDIDKKHLGNVFFITKTRLGCQARLVSDGEVVVEPVGLPAKKPAR